MKIEIKITEGREEQIFIYLDQDKIEGIREENPLIDELCKKLGGIDIIFK